MEPAEELTARPVVRRPEAIAREPLVIAQPGRQDVGFDLLARRGQPTADVAHHFGIAVQRDDVVDIVHGEAPQPHSLGLQEHVHANGEYTSGVPGPLGASVSS